MQFSPPGPSYLSKALRGPIPPVAQHEFLYDEAPLYLCRWPGADLGDTPVKQFIRNVRAAKTIADERAVIQKESASIRASFREESGDHSVRCAINCDSKRNPTTDRG